MSTLSMKESQEYIAELNREGSCRGGKQWHLDLLRAPCLTWEDREKCIVALSQPLRRWRRLFLRVTVSVNQAAIQALTQTIFNPHGRMQRRATARRAGLEKELLEIQVEEDQNEADSRSHRTTADLVSPQRCSPYGIYVVTYCGIRSLALFHSQPGFERFWYLWTPGLPKRVRAQLKKRWVFSP